MAVIPVGYGIARFVFSVTGKANEMVSTCAYVADVTGTPFEHAEAIAGFFNATGRPYQAASMAVGWSFLGVDVTEERGTGPIPASYRAPIAGTAIFGTPPVNTCWILRKYTAIGGRRGRGRQYIPPCNLNETQVDQVGVIDPAVVSSHNATQQAAWVNWVATADLAPVLLHEDGGAPTLITSVNLEGIVATQRRRLRS